MFRSSSIGCLLLLTGCNLHDPVGVVLVYEADTDRDPAAAKVPVERVVDAVRRRLRYVGEASADRDGRIEVRVYGNDSTAVRQRLERTGVLEFRIVADRRDDRHRDVIALAEEQQAQRAEKDADKSGDSEANVVLDEGSAAAKWVKVVEDEKVYFADSPQFVCRGDVDAGSAESGLEVLVMFDPYNVTGDYFDSVSAGRDRVGAPCIDFAFNPAGARRFGKLTAGNLPDYGADRFSNLAIILDRQVFSAPAIRSRIDDRGEITGNFSEAEVNELVALLGAGSLPVPLRLVDERPAPGAN